MAVEIYNTLTRQKEELTPREAGKVGMYVCGVTPYAPAHLGHGRHAVVFDVVRRWLSYRGYEVTYVMNVTDIEDKIIAAAGESGRDWREIVAEHTDSYLEQLAELGALPPTMMPKASEHIPEIVALVQRLIETGHAYQIDGDVAFHVPSFAAYGRLSRRDLDAQITGARVEEDRRKRDSRDFFLWKAAKPGEPSWESPWGPGRPGWHIECSAMSTKYLGEGFDIHGGGSDLMFPHHENEIAQSEAATGKLFARIWMHNGMLNMVRSDDPEQSEKMSKSLGNVVGMREVLEQVGGPTLRYCFIAAHYASDIPFNEAALEQAERALERLRIGKHTLDRLAAAPSRPGGAEMAELEEAAARAQVDFEEAMDDDFSTPRALAALHGLVGVVNRAGANAGANFASSESGGKRLAAARDLLTRLAGTLGLNLEEKAVEGGLAADLVEALIEVRRKAREMGQYAIADEVRRQLTALGIVLEDRPGGTTWRRR